jgi:hypothetical protein
MQKGYRALPAEVYHPKSYRIYTSTEFEDLKKDRMDGAPPMMEEHLRTIIWYVYENGYIVQVDFKNHESVLINTPCTFTPTMGMDNIDGLFAQDAEEYIISCKLDYKAERLAVFNSEDKIDIRSYLSFHDYQGLLDS